MSNKNIAKGIQKYFLLTLLVVLIITFFIFLSPFFATLFIAGIIVTAIFPIKKIGERKFKLSSNLSSTLTFFIVFVFSLLIVTFFFVFIVAEASDAYLLVNEKIENFIVKQRNNQNFLENLPLFLQNWLHYFSMNNPISLEDIVSSAGDFIGAVSRFLVDQTANILKQLSIFTLHLLVFLFGIFYFLRDGEKALKYIRSLIPLPVEYKKELFSKIHTLMYSIMVGTFGAAIAQGSFVAIGFVFVGINNAAFWGLLASLFSPIPYLGTSIVWFPAMLGLYLSGHYVAGTFLLIWGTFIVGFVDNLIKPYLIGSSATLHPFAVLLVLLGGVFVFGFRGLIFGPLILTLTLAFLHIYQLEYADILKED